jgi:hypothetical protein
MAAKNVTAGTEDPGAFTISGSATWYATTISIRPAQIPAVTTPTPTFDTPTWIFIFLILAYIALLGTAWFDDSIAWFIPAGIVMQLIAFQGWTVTTSLPVAISLSVVGIVTLLVPIGHALRGKPS